MKIGSQKVDGLLKELASGKPAPGGGSAAALAGAMGAGLVHKVIVLTIGKKKYEEVEEHFNQLKRQISKLQEELLSLVDEDTQAYLAVVKSKGSQGSVLGAAEVPLKTAQKSFEVLKMAAYVSEYGNQNLRSDAFVAMELAQVGVYGALENVRVNLPFLKDEKARSDLTVKIDDLLGETNSLVKP